MFPFKYQNTLLPLQSMQHRSDQHVPTRHIPALQSNHLARIPDGWPPTPSLPHFIACVFPVLPHNVADLLLRYLAFPQITPLQQIQAGFPVLWMMGQGSIGPTVFYQRHRSRKTNSMIFRASQKKLCVIPVVAQDTLFRKPSHLVKQIPPHHDGTRANETLFHQL